MALAPISPELVTWIPGWHTAIKVTKPGSLIEEITQKLEETLEIYDPPRPPALAGVHPSLQVTPVGGCAHWRTCREGPGEGQQ